MRLCAVPAGRESVLSDLVLERPHEEPLTLAKGVGILQIDIL
jgi:hypothetical protein